MIFKRNKKYYSLLREKRKGYWVCDNPLFICGNKGLFPVFKTGGPTGTFPKNHQELILKDISNELKEKKDDFKGL
jgi:hypothetical protein